MSSLSSIGEQLHAARVQRGISLEEIAAATRISVKFLNEIEAGIEPGVPQTYVRAFVKAFAEHVSLDANELLEQLRGIGESQQPPNSDSPHSISTAAVTSSTPVGMPHTVKNKQPSQSQLKPLLILIVILLAGLILYVLWQRSDRNERSTEEISFNDVMKEQQAKQPGVRASGDTSAQVPTMNSQPVIPDSLTLEAVASDSVWLHLVVDGGKPKEYILTKFSHLHWKAKTSFLISVGKAAAISLTLNGQKVDVVGKDSMPAKNITLSRETLQKLQTNSTKKENG